MKAWLNLRYTVPDRIKAFVSGIELHGYRAEIGFPDRIGPRDIYLSWNRINMGGVIASKFEERGQTVLIAENAAWGNDFLGRRWYSLALNRHNTASTFPTYGPERWDRLHVNPQPFRAEGETVILAQRSIGSAPTKMPTGWAEQAHRTYGGRIRRHPGTRPGTPLESDLAKCGRAVTWGSGAAVKALLWGIPVVSEMPNWIAAQDNTELGRLEMLSTLAWAQWELEEIANGDAFACLLPA